MARLRPSAGIVLVVLAACASAPADGGGPPKATIRVVDPSRPVRGIISFAFLPESSQAGDEHRTVVDRWAVDGVAQPLTTSWELFGLLVLDTRAWPNGPHLVTARVLAGDQAYEGEATLDLQNAAPEAAGVLFADVTTPAGFPPPGSVARFMSGAVAGDLDRDGDLDLVTFVGGAARVRRQRSPWSFDELALPGVSGVQTAALGDLDRDGWLDLVLAGTGVSIWRGGEAGFTNVTGDAGLPAWALEGQSFRSITLADVDEDGLLDVLVANMACGRGANLVLHHEGALRFAEVAGSLGMDLEKGATFALVLDRPDASGPDELWAYEEGCTPQQTHLRTLSPSDGLPVAGEAREPSLARQAPMGSQWLDANRDGVLDLLAAGGALSTLWAGPSYGVDLAAPAGLSTWLDAERRATAAWSTVMFDADLDGLPDLFVVHDPDGGPSQGPRLPKHAFYRHDQPGRFTESARAVGLDVEAACRAATGADLDGDGDLDLIAGCWDGLRLYRNDAPTKGLARTVELEGGLSDPHGVQAQLVSSRGDRRLVRGGGQTYASGLQPQNLALGAGDRLSVAWPSGLAQDVSIEAAAGPVVRVSEPLRLTPSSRRVKPGETVTWVLEGAAGEVKVASGSGELAFVDVGEGRREAVWTAPAAPGDVRFTVSLDGRPLRVRPRVYVRP